MMNVDGLYSCTCTFYCQYKLVCNHMMIVLDPILHEMSSSDSEIVSLRELVDIKPIYIKVRQADQQILPLEEFIEREPIITQLMEADKVLNRNEKYKQAFEVFQRFAARTAQVGTAHFEKLMKIFVSFVKSAEQNDIDDYIRQHNFEKLFDTSFSTPPRSTRSSLRRSISHESSLNHQSIAHSLTASVRTPLRSPFTLVAVRNPIGRPKGSKKQTATSFHSPQPKRKACRQLHNLNIKKTVIEKTTTTTGVNITTHTTTTITEISTNSGETYNVGDNTLEDCEEED